MERLGMWWWMKKAIRYRRKYLKANPFPRPMSTVVVKPEMLKNYKEDIFGKDNFIYYGEVPNDPEHCIVQRLRGGELEESEQGKKYGYLPFKAHCYEFKEATDEEMGYDFVEFDWKGNVIKKEIE
jgi:hypothetical protein